MVEAKTWISLAVEQSRVEEPYLYQQGHPQRIHIIDIQLPHLLALCMRICSMSEKIYSIQPLELYKQEKITSAFRSNIQSNMTMTSD